MLFGLNVFSPTTFPTSSIVTIFTNIFVVISATFCNFATFVIHFCIYMDNKKVAKYFSQLFKKSTKKFSVTI